MILDSTDQLRCANLGDSRFIILRRKPEEQDSDGRNQNKGEYGWEKVDEIYKKICDEENSLSTFSDSNNQAIIDMIDTPILEKGGMDSMERELPLKKVYCRLPQQGAKA